MKTSRIFLGSFTRHPGLDQLYFDAQKLLSPTGKFKWTRTPENLHLTFHFFGEIPLDKIHLIQTGLNDILGRKFPVNLRINEVSFFKRKHKPAVLFAKIEPNKALTDLYHTIQDRLCQNRLIAEKNTRFVPHITLARIKKVQPDFDTKITSLKPENPIIINEVTPEIIESILAPEGALYKKYRTE